MPPGTPTGTRATVARGSPPNAATTSTPRASADGPLDDRGLEASPHAQRVERSAQCPRRVAVGGLQRGDAAEHVAAARPAGCPPRTVLENGGAPMEERSDDGAGLRTTSSDRPCRPLTSRRSGRPMHRCAHPARRPRPEPKSTRSANSLPAAGAAATRTTNRRCASRSMRPVFAASTPM
jgi:hypothetical protein